MFSLIGKRHALRIILVFLAALLLPSHLPLQAQDSSTLFLPLITSNANPAAAQPTPAVIVPDQYIVILRDEITRPSQLTDAAMRSRARAAAQRVATAAERMGGKILYTYASAVTGFAAQMSADAASVLAADPDVALVEPDQIVQISDFQTPAVWGLDRIDQPDRPLDNTYTYPNRGAGVHVYIIDTGMRTRHREFSERVGDGFSAINDGRGVEDCNSHGTHVAGTVGGATYGVAKAVTLHPVRVLDCDGQGTNAQVIAGIDWVTANHVKPAVANMSLGGSASTALDNAVRTSIAAGVFYAVAAGNENTNACYGSPARVAEAMTIGATTATDQRAAFSNYGNCVDLFAPGQNITSAVIESDTATASYSGTSMAAPHVAGAAALFLASAPTAAPAAVTAALRDQATPDRLTDVKSGSPNLLLYVGLIDSNPLPTVTATPAVAPTLTATPSATPTATTTPLPTTTATATATATQLPPTPTATATAGLPTLTPTATITDAVPTLTPTATSTSAAPTPTATPSPTPSAIASPTPLPTAEPGSCIDAMQNGDFEAGVSGWTERSALDFPLICDGIGCSAALNPHSGAYVAWLGGANRERAEIAQPVTIPAAQPAALHFWYQIDSEDLCGYDDGYVEVAVNGVTTTLLQLDLCEETSSPTWTQAQLDLSYYAGQTVTVRFVATTDYWLRSSFFVDDVALRIGSLCPTAVTASSAVNQPLTGTATEPHRR